MRFPGSSNVIQIGVTNLGPATSTNWSLTAELPSTLLEPGGLLNGQTGPGTCSISGWTITCSGSSLAVGESMSVDVYVTSAAAGTERWFSYASGDQPDPDPQNSRGSSYLVIREREPAPAGSGDWGTTGSALMAPGTSEFYDVAFTCLSADGCDYGPGITITDQAHPDAIFGTGTNHLYLNGETDVGDCQVTEEAIDCAVTESGRADQGDVLSSRAISYGVSDSAPADTQVFAQTIAFPEGWTGNDPSNDVYPISTPVEVGASIVSWQAGAGLGGLVLLLGGGALLWHRRQQQPQPIAA